MTNPKLELKSAGTGSDPDLEGVTRLAAHMQVLSGLYHGVVHDLKSPLNAMVVNLELLKVSLSPTPQVDRQRRYVEILHEELMRLNRSIETLLPAAAPPRDEVSRFDLRALVEEVGALVSTTARHQSVKIAVEAGGEAAEVHGYRDRIKLALLCLVANGLEAMPKGGRLTLELEVRGDQAVLTVSDTGSGVPDEAGDRIYERHYSTKAGHQGLGLHVARSAVEFTKGSIRHVARGDEGSRFTVTLPLAD